MMRTTAAAVLTIAGFLVTGCTSATPLAAPTSTGATTPEVVAVFGTRDTEGSAPTPETTPAAPTTTAATTTAATDPTTSTAAATSSGWTPQPIGTIDAAIGGVDLMAFNPAGQAVAFSTLERSCCSNDVRAWFRQADGKWNQIDDQQANFVAGPKGTGAFGGPSDVVWFTDRFVAIGTRGGSVEPETKSASTTWVSTDGQTWTATDETLSSSPVGLSVSLDGRSLLSVWRSDAGKVVIRSTTDAKTWTYLSSFSADNLGESLQPFSISIVKNGTDGPRQLAIVGSVALSKTNASSIAFIATSSDGLTWTTAALPSPSPAVAGSAVVAKQVVIVDGTLTIYGNSYAAEAEADSKDTSLVWISTSTSNDFSVATVSPGCPGSLSNVVLDQSAPETTLFGICAAQDGPQEGDYVASFTTLVISHDSVTFTPAELTPVEWGAPSTETDIGPIALDNGSVVMALTQAVTADERAMTLWKP